MKSIKSILSKCGTENGIVIDMPRRKYDEIHRLNPSSISKGFVDHQEVDPMAVKFAFEDSQDDKRAAAAQDRMDRGTLAHMLLLQPERVNSEVAVWHGSVRKGAEWDGFEDENKDKLIIKQSDWNEVNQAVKKFRFEPKLNEVLTELDAEVAMFSSEGPIYTKGLVDAITTGDVCKIIDLKTTEAGFSAHSVETTIRNFHNREKMAAYKRWYEKESGREVIGCYNIFLSMVPPYAIRIVKMTTIALEWGQMRLLYAIDQVQRCLDDGKWPMFVANDYADVKQFEMPYEGEEVQLDFGDN